MPEQAVGKRGHYSHYAMQMLHLHGVQPGQQIQGAGTVSH